MKTKRFGLSLKGAHNSIYTLFYIYNNVYIHEVLSKHKGHDIYKNYIKPKLLTVHSLYQYQERKVIHKKKLT